MKDQAVFIVCRKQGQPLDGLGQDAIIIQLKFGSDYPGSEW